MSKKNDQIKKQRDRFLAFAFASADLFMEVSEDGTVLFALGAARTLTGINDKNIIGQTWLSIFSESDKPTLLSMKDKAKAGKRAGPYLVTLDEMLGGGKKAIVTGIKMPNSKNYYITLGFSNVLMASVAERVSTSAELLDKDSFVRASQDAINLARSLGQEIDVTLLDIANASESREKFGEEVWDSFEEQVSEFLSSKSLDGQTAAQIENGKYSVIHDKSIDKNYLTEQLSLIAQQADPEGQGIDLKSKSVSGDLSTLNERETTKALIYTINEFERKGTNLTMETLNTGFKDYVAANVEKVNQFKNMVEQLSFHMNFQPIVDLKSLKCTHYEMLTRFRGGGSPEEWIIFAEDIGMAPDFDMAVCERAINYLKYKSAGQSTRFAVNLSGQSVQSEGFFNSLYSKLKEHPNLSQRLMFEITESTQIDELEMVNHFIDILQKDGYKVCLDDFGAGSASFKYIQQLHVDYVKIDGMYTMKVLKSDRDRVLIKNLAQMCKDLGIKVVAERIEVEAEIERMKQLGVDYGQGYLFSKPTPKPDYVPPEQSDD
jgi:EAL domain-containing protein (putative c-di-GMP-specific phosphodiesterase class I)